VARFGSATILIGRERETPSFQKFVQVRGISFTAHHPFLTAQLRVDKREWVQQRDHLATSKQELINRELGGLSNPFRIRHQKHRDVGVDFFC